MRTGLRSSGLLEADFSSTLTGYFMCVMCVEHLNLPPTEDVAWENHKVCLAINPDLRRKAVAYAYLHDGES